ncbi:MAG: hypothetical protein HC779_02440 [Phyllobacteriaceae bacterium]|nr:hypothetical protein [Phyllobacteriaceae bacterium]
MRPKTGTSFAAPFVTAALAVAGFARPAEPFAQVLAQLKADALDLGVAGADPVFGHGLVQAGKLCPL